MKKNNIFKVSALVLSAVTLLTGLCSCGATKAPELSEVKDTFSALIEKSAEVNDIFFGSGLAVYDREEASGDGNLLYDGISRTHYAILDNDGYAELKYYDKDSKKYLYGSVIDLDLDPMPEGIVIHTEEPYAGVISVNTEDHKNLCFMNDPDFVEEVKELVYSDDSPTNYDYVRADAKYQSVDEIKALAGTIYSASYLKGIYTTIFDGFVTDEQIVYARYMADESGKTSFLLKSNQFTPYFETQTTYDLSSMKIVAPSSGELVNVEITATGVHIDYEKLEKVNGTYQKNLKFVKENGEWRLDTPTY